MRVVAADMRQVVETPVVLRSGCVTEISLHQRDEVFGKFTPPTGRGSIAVDVIPEVYIVTCFRHCEVAGKQVVERWNVRRALDRRMTAQRQNPAAGPADVSQQ